MRTIFNSFIGIATILDLGYRYLGPPTTTDNRIVKIHKSLGRLKTQMRLLREEVVGEIKGLREDMEGKPK
jgi:hypothetical protein